MRCGRSAPGSKAHAVNTGPDEPFGPEKRGITISHLGTILDGSSRRHGLSLLWRDPGPDELLPDQALQQLPVPLADAEDAPPQPGLVTLAVVSRGEQVAVELPFAVDDPSHCEPLDGR